MIARLALLALLCLWGLDEALATPARIIILRHGEKADSKDLCGIGQMRANALVSYYLGRGAAKSLFAAGEEPAGILTITLHTEELAAPIAASWGRSLTPYPAMHRKGLKQKAFEEELNSRTQAAAQDVMTNPRYAGKTVIMVWEHKHIANGKLEAMSGAEVTLRQLLNLNRLDGVPATWPSSNYDYFWIVEYGNPASDVPIRISLVKQEFGEAYGAIPSNDWNTPNGLTPESCCDLKGAQD